MKVVFRTNVDPKHGMWHFPEQVCCKPEIGELVQPTNGDKTLKVCSITHCWDGDKQPYLEVELTRCTY